MYQALSCLSSYSCSSSHRLTAFYSPRASPLLISLSFSLSSSFLFLFTLASRTFHWQAPAEQHLHRPFTHTSCRSADQVTVLLLFSRDSVAKNLPPLTHPHLLVLHRQLWKWRTCLIRYVWDVDTLYVACSRPLHQYWEVQSVNSLSLTSHLICDHFSPQGNF